MTEPTPATEDEREALKVALTEGIWHQTGHRYEWKILDQMIDAILAAGFRLHPTPSVEDVARELASVSSGRVCAPNDPDIEWQGWVDEARAVIALFGGEG